MAIIGQIYRNSYLESNVAIFLDENRKIVATKRITAGIVGQAGDFNISELRAIKEKTGAKYIAELHNHPHGNTGESQGDKSVHARLTEAFGDEYLGTAIVDTGEATVLSNKNNPVTGQIEPIIRSRIPLTKEELGWDTDSKEFKTTRGHRMDDPLVRGRERSDLYKYLDVDDPIPLAKMANFINTGHNMTTLIFKDFNNTVTNMVDYPDLHLLSADDLWKFIHAQALEFGGYKVDAFVGKGDWYDSVSDVIKTGWDQVSGAKRFRSHTLDLIWFDGLPFSQAFFENQGEASFLPLHADYAKYPDDITPYRAEGSIIEQVSDVTAEIPQELLDVENDAYKDVEKNIADNIKNKEAIFGYLINDENALAPIINSAGDSALKRRLKALGKIFSSFVINKHILGWKDISGKLKTKDEIYDAIKLYEDLDRRVVWEGYDPKRTYKDGFMLARAANITDADRVMTIGDTHGVLATMARRENKNAHIESIGVDKFTADLYSKVIPGVVDRMDAIDYRNLSHQYEGKRPTVILLDGDELISTGDISAVDEAMKILAPHGRLVVKSRSFITKGKELWNEPLNMLGGYVNSDAKLLARKYRHTQFKSNDPGHSLYTIIDKVNPSHKIPKIGDNYDDVVGYYTSKDFIGDERETRIPVDENTIADYEGITPDEQTFAQPIGNPISPYNISGVGSAGTLSDVAQGPDPPSGESQVGQDISGTGALAGGDLAGGGELSPTGEDAGLSSIPAPEAEMGDEVGRSDTERSGLGEGDAIGGEDAAATMEEGSADPSMRALQGRDAGVGSERTSVEVPGTPADTGVEDGGVVPASGRSPTLASTTTSNGIAKTTVKAPAKDVKGFEAFESGSLERGKNRYAHILNPDTAKKTLEKIGGAALDVLEDIKFIRNWGDINSLRAKKNLEIQSQRIKKYIRRYAKSNKMNTADAAREFSEILTAVSEDRWAGVIPAEVQQAVDDIQNFNKEHVEARIFASNQKILDHGRLFDLDLENKKFMDNGLREEIESPLNNFSTFAFKRKHKGGGHLRKFVQNKKTGEVFGVLYHGDTITLVDPLGRRVKNADIDIFSNQNANYTTLIERGEPRKTRAGGMRNQAWMDMNGQTARQSGALASVQASWDYIMNNVTRPDVIRKAFMDNGITLPDKFRFSRVKKVGNINHWAVIDKTGRRAKTVYILKEILPVGTKETTDASGAVSETDIESHSFYNPWKKKLLVYDAKVTRDPTWILDETRPVKLWEPEDNYFPHIVDFEAIAKDPDSYAAAMVDVNPGLTEEQAMMWIKKRLHSGRTRRHGFLEQQRKYNLPDFNKNFFEAWEQYYAGALHRVEMIERWGQDESLLTAKIQELYHSDAVMAEMDDIEKGVLKLRQAIGYNDFSPYSVVRNSEMVKDRFYTSDGDPEPLDRDFLSVEEWRVLTDAGLVEYNKDTDDYSAKDRTALTNPIFLNGKLKDAELNAAIVSDIVVNQFGWRERDVFDRDSEKFLVNGSRDSPSAFIVGCANLSICEHRISLWTCPVWQSRD